MSETIFIERGIHFPERTYHYPPIPLSDSVTSIILSPNGHIDATVALEFSVETANEVFDRLLIWSGPDAEFSGQPADNPHIDGDIYTVPASQKSIRIRTRVLTPAGEYRVDRMGIGLLCDARNNAEPSFETTDVNGSTPLAVPFISQFSSGSAEDQSRCCPTAAVMVLQYWGLRVSIEEFIGYSFDRANNIYGNWSLTAATLSLYGLRAWVEQHSSFETVHHDLLSQRPVIVSLAWGDSELSGAPIEKTSGHLMVVRGINEHGNIIVNDPAGKNAAEGQRVYNKNEFLRAWFGHGGFAIHAAKVEGGDG